MPASSSQANTLDTIASSTVDYSHQTGSAFKRAHRDPYSGDDRLKRAWKKMERESLKMKPSKFKVTKDDHRTAITSALTAKNTCSMSNTTLLKRDVNVSLTPTMSRIDDGERLVISFGTIIASEDGRSVCGGDGYRSPEQWFDRSHPQVN
ncbi:hypothetical protein P7C73_g2381, partial [Tremellales sp. Uapishka_1]